MTEQYFVSHDKDKINGNAAAVFTHGDDNNINNDERIIEVAHYY